MIDIKIVSREFQIIKGGIENLKENLFQNRDSLELKDLDIEKLCRELNSIASKLDMFGSYFVDGSLKKIYFDHNVSMTKIVLKINEIIDHLKKKEM